MAAGLAVCHCCVVFLSLLNRVRAARKTRNLASDRRAGTYAKQKAYNLNLQFAKRKWPLLASVVLVVPAVTGCLGLLLPTPWRGIVLGVGLASGVWMAWLVVVTFSGSTAMTAGASAEEWTASELRRRRRWRLVNGLSLKHDIDHVAVGDGGVLVVETKWSAQPWDDRDPFIRDRLEQAKRQLEENLRHVTLVYRQQLAAAPVFGLLVLWSTQPGREPQREGGPGQISIIPAKRLRSWLDERPAEAVSRAVQQDVVAALTRKVDELDRHRARIVGPPRPSFQLLMIRWVAEPFAATTVGVYATTLAAKAGTTALLAELVAATTLGLIARRHERFRWIGNAVVATNVALALAVLLAALVLANGN